ncbi:MAG TPA: hypothetical protein VK480_05215 [Solirubrobacterales bacterium]|nr:hypothetical protein [Solirubrobacterales bacterium]
MYMRESWTDERLDDFKENVYARFDQVDARFDRVDADIRELRQTMIQGFVALSTIVLTSFLGLAGLIVF